MRAASLFVKLSLDERVDWRESAGRGRAGRGGCFRTRAAGVSLRNWNLLLVENHKNYRPYKYRQNDCDSKF
jgi:hypothetical protein